MRCNGSKPCQGHIKRQHSAKEVLENCQTQAFEFHHIFHLIISRQRTELLHYSHCTTEIIIFQKTSAVKSDHNGCFSTLDLWTLKTQKHQSKLTYSSKHKGWRGQARSRTCHLAH